MRILGYPESVAFSQLPIFCKDCLAGDGVNKYRSHQPLGVFTSALLHGNCGGTLSLSVQSSRRETYVNPSTEGE